MKAFIWLLTVALVVVCLTAWVMSGLVELSLQELGVPAPNITHLIIHPHWWLFAAPFPWIVYACLLTARRELTSASVFIFAGALTLFGAILVSALALALALPYIPLHI